MSALSGLMDILHRNKNLAEEEKARQTKAIGDFVEDGGADLNSLVENMMAGSFPEPTKESVEEYFGYLNTRKKEEALIDFAKQFVNKEVILSVEDINSFSEEAMKSLWDIWLEEMPDDGKEKVYPYLKENNEVMAMLISINKGIIIFYEFVNNPEKFMSEEEDKKEFLELLTKPFETALFLAENFANDNFLITTFLMTHIRLMMNNAYKEFDIAEIFKGYDLEEEAVYQHNVVIQNFHYIQYLLSNLTGSNDVEKPDFEIEWKTLKGYGLKMDGELIFD